MKSVSCPNLSVEGLLAIVLVLASLSLLAGCRDEPTKAVSNTKVHQVGVILTGAKESAIAPAPLRETLRARGWTEGKDLVFQWRYAEGHPERYAGFAAELVGLKVDVIVASSDGVVVAAMAATSTIPIVFAACGDPVRQGFVASLAHPGGNLTGSSGTCSGSQLHTKQLELLKKTVPGASRIPVLWYLDTPDKDIEVTETIGAARALGLQMRSLRVQGPDDFVTAFENAARAQADAILILQSGFMITQREQLAQLAGRYHLPALYGAREYVAQAGGLMAYGPNVPDIYRRVADHVDKILRGAKPGDLPVDQPTTFEFVINLKTAASLGLTIPPAIRAQATEVIQ
jgi:putative ABC transport system substrate-binding protein